VKVLVLLRVRDFAIIEEVTVELGPGLGVITGETGSGKSMLIAALKLVLGGRADPDVVRAGADRAEVEAVFDLRGRPDVRTRLAELDVEEADELVVRRTVVRSGRSRTTLNGRLVTVAQLEALTAGLVEVCGQRASYGLVDRSTHLEALDDFAALGTLRQTMAAAWTHAQALDAKVRQIEGTARQGEREDFLRFQLAELEALDPRAGEEESLRASRERLRHGELLSGSAREVEQALSEDDGILPRLHRLESRVGEAARHDADLGALRDRLTSARVDLEELARDLDRYADRVPRDPDALETVETRLAAIEKLLRRHGPTVDAALARMAEMRAELAGLGDREVLLERTIAARDQAAVDARSAATALSRARLEHAARLGEAVTKELLGLGMGSARVEVEVSENEDLSPTGADRVEFLIAPNPGEEPRPLGKIASGGELSRALLALRCVLAARSGDRTVLPDRVQVFDEVDTGVGGAVAEVVGRKLATVAKAHQVLCITHLPQVAAQASHHVCIRKWVSDGRTFVAATVLDSQGRREEIARMLGGVELTEPARRAADDLLERAAR
jgi:DNA repair protein RecN (Recombination protein N)